MPLFAVHRTESPFQPVPCSSNATIAEQLSGLLPALEVKSQNAPAITLKVTQWAFATIADRTSAENAYTLTT